MSPVIQEMHARAYGHFLASCHREGMLDVNASAAALVTPELVATFLNELSHRVGSVTRSNYVQRTLRVATTVAPQRDFGWLRDLVVDLKDGVRPRPKAHRIVESNRLLSLGLSLIRCGEESTEKKHLVRARLVRDGLMIAILSVCPIRLKNFASLRLGKQIQRVDGVWWIILSAVETKSRRPDERPLPAFLIAPIDRWVERWRTQFPNSGSAFWPSSTGGAMAYAFVSRTISATTQRELGVAVNPHLFRDCSVYTIAINAGDQMGMASALLQHTDARVTQEHYNRGAMHKAAKTFEQIVDQITANRHSSQKRIVSED